MKTKNQSALTLFNNEIGGAAIAKRDFKHKTQLTLKVLPFKQWYCADQGVDIDDKEAVKQAMSGTRGKGELRKEYKQYRQNMTNQIAALRSEATRELEYSGVQVKVCKTTGAVLNYREDYAEVVTPKSLVPRVTANTELKNDLSEAMKVIAQLKQELEETQNKLPAIEV